VAPILLWLIMVLCLLISLVKYLMGLILRVSFPGTQVRKDYTYQPPVSVLMPCFNEGRTVYQTIESISKSNYPNGSFEVIAQDDCSVDDSYQWILKAQRDFTNIPIRAGRNQFNCGKARTVCNALEHSTAEVIISIDSDCIFHPDAIRELTACFAEPRMGSVGGRVGVSNPTTASSRPSRLSSITLHSSSTKSLKTGLAASAASADAFSRFDANCCLKSSRPSAPVTGSVSRQPGRRPLPHASNAAARYGTYINTDALCWTTVPNTLSVLFKQQLRWRRSIVRDFFYTLRTLPQHVWKLHPNTVFTLVLTPSAQLLRSLWS